MELPVSGEIVGTSVASAAPRTSAASVNGVSVGRAWANVVLLSAFYMLSMLDRNLLSLLAQPIKRNLAFSDTQIGLLYGAAFSIFYVIAALPIGALIDRFSRRWVIWGGTVVWSLGTAFCGQAGGFGSFFAARSIVGAGEATINPGSQSIVADSFPPNKLAAPVSVVSIGSKLGAGVSFVIGGLLTSYIDPDTQYSLPLVGAVHGWRLIFFLVGFPGILFAFVIFLVREPVRDRQARPVPLWEGFTEYWAFVRRNWSFFLPHHLATLFLFASMAALVVWAPAFFERAYGMKPAQSGPWMGLALTLGPVLAMPLHGWLVDRSFTRGRRNAHLRYLMITGTICMPFAVAAYLLPSFGQTLGAMAIAATVMSGYIGLPATAMQLVARPQFRAKASASLVIFQAGGTVLGSAVPALINDTVFVHATGIGDSVAISIALMLPLAVLLCGVAARHMSRLVAV
jgi:MFS family permease